MAKIKAELEVPEKDCNDCDYFDFLCSICTIFNKKVYWDENKDVHKRCDKCKQSEEKEQ